MRGDFARSALCAAVMWGTLALTTAAHAAPGDLDSTGFGTAGIFTAPVQAGASGGAAERHRVAIDAQGRALLAFARDDDADNRGDAVMVARLTESGTLDTTFNPAGLTPGLVEVSLGVTLSSGDDVHVRGVRPGPGGTILVLARVFETATPTDIVLVRLTPEGQLDGDFGTGGRVIDTDVAGYVTDAFALAVDGQGRPLVGGYTQDIPDFNGPSVKRYTASGAPDSGWGMNGIAPLPNGYQIADIEALSDNKVIVGGYEAQAFAARLTDTGALDGTFSGDGIATANLGQYSGGVGWGQSVAADSQGRVIVGGYAFASEFVPVGAIARFTSSGELDTGFGAGTGAPVQGVAWRTEFIRDTSDIVIGCGDRILAAGLGRVGSESNFSISRLTAHGTLDTAFGPAEPTPGIIVSDLGAMEYPTALAVDAKGRAYVAGTRFATDPAVDNRALIMRRLDATGCAAGEQPPGPPTPPSEPPTTGGGGNGGPTSRVAARFTGPARSTGLAMTRLDARTSTDVSRYRWDLNGDGKDDIDCGGDQPLVEARLATASRAGTANVRLTVFGSGGATATTSQAVSVATSSAAQRLAGSVAQPLSCVSDRTVTVQRRPCAHETIDFGAVSADSCFSRIESRTEVPAGELPIIDAAVAYFNENQRRRNYVFEACAEVRQRDCVRKEGEITRAEVDPLLQATNLRISRTKVKVNGLEFIPQGGATIAVFPQIGRIVSSNAIVKFGDATVPIPRQVNLDVEGNGTIYSDPFKAGGRIELLSFKPNVPFTDFAGFSIDGEVKLELVDGGRRKYSEATFRLALPNEFAVFGGKPPSGLVRVQADNENGVVLEEIDLQVPEADFGGLRFSDVRFHYTRAGREGCPGKFWKATARIYLGVEGDAAGFRLAPDPPQNGIAFCQGDFKSAGGEFTFGGAIPPPQIFPGVFLKAINFATQLDPTLVRGGGTISAAGITEVDGSVLGVFASPGSPYTLSHADAVGGLEPLGKLAGRRLQSTTIAAGGTFGFSLPAIGRVDFGTAYFLYAYPDYVALGGSVLIPAPGVVITAGIDGEMGISSSLYSFHGQAKACIAGGISSLGCIGGEAWVTSKGIVVCGSIAGEIHPGVGYKWGDTFPEIWTGIPGDGCKPSGYWLDAPIGPARAAQAGGARTFRVAPGVNAVRVRIIGSGGAPDVTVKGPDGETISTAAAEYVKGRSINAVRHLPGGVTWLGIRAKSGEYTITPNPGSPAIRSVATSEPAALPKITATVKAAGARRTLSYRVDSLGRDEQVTFYERGATTYRRLGTTTKASGSISYAPEGAAGARRITALVEIRGMRVGETTVARYGFAPQRPGRPGALKVVRRGKVVTVSWPAARGAARYGVVISPASGAERIMRVRRGRQIRLTGTSVAGGGVVQVTGLDAEGRPGKPRTARWRASGAKTSRFRPFRELRAAARR